MNSNPNNSIINWNYTVNQQFSTLQNTPKRLLQIVFLFLSLMATGQTDFRPGYYFTWENDTVFGLIDYRGEIRNSRLCEYKADKNSRIVKFNPDDIKAYRFTNSKYYTSKEVQMEDTKEKYFLELLVDGIYNLYFLQTPEKQYFFIESEEGTPVSLYKAVRNVTINGEIKTKIYTNHVGIMKTVFAACKEIQPLIDRSELSHKPLIDITRKYHDYMCTSNDECIVYEKELSKIKILFSPVIGISQTMLSMKGGFFERVEYNKSTSPTYGILFDIVFPRNNNKISVQSEIVYGSYEIYGIYNNYYELFLGKNDFIQPSLGIKYTLPGKKVRPSISVGGLSTFQFTVNAYAKVHFEGTETINEITLNNFPLEKNLYGAYFQLGSNIKLGESREMFVNVKYILRKAKHPTLEETIVNNLNSLNINIGFYLNKFQ